MNLSDLSIRRPVFATVMSLLLIVLGIMAFSRLTLREHRALLVAAEFHQRRAGLDPIATFKMDDLHGLADLGGHGHRFARLDRAERTDRVAPRLRFHHGCSDRGGRHGRPLARRIVAARGNADADEHGQCERGKAGRGHGYGRSIHIRSILAPGHESPRMP
jgi:hypothetical protein